MKYLVITSVLGLSLTLTVRAGAQELPAAPAPEAQPAPQEPPATYAPQEQPAATAPQAQLPAPQAPPAGPPQSTMPAPPAPPSAVTAPAVATTVAVPDRKSPEAAFAWSLSGTALGVGLLAAGIHENKGSLAWMGLLGLTVGPSFGYFYAGEYGRAMGHIGLRAGAKGILFAGFVSAIFDCGLFGDSECESRTTTDVLLVSGLVLEAGSIAYSIYDAPRAARRHNKARQRRLVLTPAPVAGPDHTSGFGLQLSGSF